jgi:hypothetical protein
VWKFHAEPPVCLVALSKSLPLIIQKWESLLNYSLKGLALNIVVFYQQ